MFVIVVVRQATRRVKERVTEVFGPFLTEEDCRKYLESKDWDVIPIWQFVKLDMYSAEIHPLKKPD